MSQEFLKWRGLSEATLKGQICIIGTAHKTVTTVRIQADYLTFEKPPARVVFSFTGQEITQEKVISRKILLYQDIQPQRGILKSSWYMYRPDYILPRILP